jgi:hypothetical protein
VRTRCIRAGRAPVNNWLDAHLAILSGARTDDRKSARRSTGFSLSSESRPLCLAFIPFLLRESEAIEETVRSPGLRMMRERQRATESDRERQRAAERERERAVTRWNLSFSKTETEGAEAGKNWARNNPFMGGWRAISDNVHLYIQSKIFSKLSGRFIFLGKRYLSTAIFLSRSI